MQVGWAVGPPALCAAVTSVRQWTTFCGITPLQEAVAVGFEQANAQQYNPTSKISTGCPCCFDASSRYFSSMKHDFQRKRDALVKILEAAGLMCCVPQGGYFIMANTHGLPPPAQSSGECDAGDGRDTKDTLWCKWLTTQGVTCIPPSAFYSDEHAPMAEGWARFAFCKQVARPHFNNTTHALGLLNRCSAGCSDRGGRWPAEGPIRPPRAAKINAPCLEPPPAPLSLCSPRPAPCNRSKAGSLRLPRPSAAR